jgi:hypothetical protein
VCGAARSGALTARSIGVACSVTNANGPNWRRSRKRGVLAGRGPLHAKATKCCSAYDSLTESRRRASATVAHAGARDLHPHHPPSAHARGKAQILRGEVQAPHVPTGARAHDRSCAICGTCWRGGGDPSEPPRTGETETGPRPGLENESAVHFLLGYGQVQVRAME